MVNIKKLLQFLFVVVLMLSLAGCVSSELDAQGRIQAYLERKYDGTFQVEDVTYIAPSPDEPFSVGYYTGTAVHTETNLSFEVTCQVVGTGDVCDYYAKAVYGETLDWELRSTFAQHPSFELEELELNWHTSPDDWNPSMPFDEFILQPNICSVDATLSVPEEGLVEQSDALLELCQALDALNSTMRFGIILQIEGVQAKAKIPEKHQLDINQLRSDLEQIAAYAGEEHTINRVLQTFHAEHGYLYEISLSNEFFFVNSGDTYFGVRLTMPEVCPTERAEDVFQLCQALRTEGIDFGLRIYTADSQSSVFIQKEETEDIANIEETLRELEESPSTQE